MRPIPVAFHIWFLEVHTYGIGLALTFWFGLRYTERRLRNAGYPWQWVTGMFVWVIVSAIVGARAFHVISDLSYYTRYPGQIIAIWQGGLSSFGGLIFAVPVAIVSTRRRCPQLPTMRFADLMAPVLMACWGLGRLLGPQLMVAGGGHPTHQWFGMYYAGQPGKRLPVPIFQSMEDFSIFVILLLVERWLRNNGPAPVLGADGVTVVKRLLPPSGIVLGVGMVLWGIERYLDEHLWLGEDGHLGSLLVQWAGGILAVTGIVLLAFRIKPLQGPRSAPMTPATVTSRMPGTIPETPSRLLRPTPRQSPTTVRGRSCRPGRQPPPGRATPATTERGRLRPSGRDGRGDRGGGSPLGGPGGAGYIALPTSVGDEPRHGHDDGPADHARRQR
jgi:phosphatidylglycerol:prolipoprotein diacylglycerol transferase